MTWHQVIHVEAKKETRRRIVRELHIMHECNSEYIVNFYGAFLSDNNDVIMCMEYMDVGCVRLFLIEDTVNPAAELSIEYRATSVP